MEQEHPTDLLPLLMLGMLDPEEARIVREHVAHCVVCQQEAEAFRQSMLGDSEDSTQLQPRAHVRQHLMQRVHTAIGAPARRPTAWQRLGLTFAFAGVVTTFMLAVFFLYTINQPASPVAALVNPTPTSVPDPVEQFAGTPGTAAHMIVIIAAAPAAQATLYTHSGDPRVGFIANQLPPAPHGHTYQLWVAVGDTQVSLGTFDPHDGHVQMIGSAPAPIDTYTAAMVTIEPTGGSAKPSTKVLWLLEL